MVSPAFYRQEAARCRALAAGTHDPEAAERWLRIASDYETLAAAIENQTAPPPVMRAPMQQQPVQQPQSKTDPDDT